MPGFCMPGHKYYTIVVQYHVLGILETTTLSETLHWMPCRFISLNHVFFKHLNIRKLREWYLIHGKTFMSKKV